MNLKEDLKKFWEKFWYLLWKDESLKGWIFAVVFLFIFIKFIFLGWFLPLVTGTSLPLAIVESCSMYHKGDLFSGFDSWWARHEDKYEPYLINKTGFEEFFFKKGFNKGDILFMIKAKPEKLEIGDVILFEGGTKNPIIHRIINISVEGEQYIFSTMGDNNNGQLSVEKSITPDQIVGKSSFRIAPFLGWAKLIFFDWQKPPEERGLCSEN